MFLSVLGYVLATFLIIFFIVLTFLAFRGASIKKETSRLIAIIASILWVLMMPLSGIIALVGVVGSGAPGTKIWVFPLAAFALLLVFLLSLYSITNVWKCYKSDQYVKVVHVAMAPYVGIILFVAIVASQFIPTSTLKSDLAKQDVPVVTDQASDPIKLFQNKFNTGNYRVFVTGVKGSPEPFYFEQGELVRVGDPNDGVKKIDSVIKNGKLFVVDTNKETFRSFDVQSTAAKTIIENLKLLFFLDPLIKTAEKVHLTWRSLDKDEVQISNRHEEVSGDGYLANQILKLDYGDNLSESIAVKLFLDQTTGLITTILTSRETTSAIWGATRFQFDPLSTNEIEEIKRFPMDYQQQK